MKSSVTISQPDAISEIKFCAWVAQAEPGELLEYHRGSLSLDRGYPEQKNKDPNQVQIDEMSARVFCLAERGFLHLLQKRIGDACFSYLAIVRPCPDGQSINFSTLMNEEAN